MSPRVKPPRATAIAVCSRNQDLPIFGLPARSVSPSTKYPGTTYLIGSNFMVSSSFAFNMVGGGGMDPLGLVRRAGLRGPTPCFANIASAICSGVLSGGMSFAPDDDQHFNLCGGPRLGDLGLEPLQTHCNLAELLDAQL